MGKEPDANPEGKTWPRDAYEAIEPLVVDPKSLPREMLARFFDDPTVPALISAVRRLEDELGRFDPADARRNAERFDRRHFKARMMALVDRALAGRSLLRSGGAEAPAAVRI